MPRARRTAPGGYVYHVLNFGVGGKTIFNKIGDYQAFTRVLVETCGRRPGVELLAYCLMPNHWHLLLRPRRGGELSQYMRLLTLTHTQRYHAKHGTAGDGPVYHGRFKSFPIQDGGSFLTAARYVEGNALRAGLVERAEDWRWSSLHVRREGPAEVAACLADWPVKVAGAVAGAVPGAGGVPRQWLRTVNAVQAEKELEAVRLCVKRGRPMGSEGWVKKAAAKMGLGSSLRGVGRPRKDA